MDQICTPVSLRLKKTWNLLNVLWYDTLIMWYCKFGKPHSAPASINWNLNLLIDPQFSTAKTNDFAMTRGIFLWTWKSGFKHRRIIFQDQRPELTDEHIFDKTKCLWTRITFFSTFFIITQLPEAWGRVPKNGNLKWHFPWRGGGLACH